MKIMWLIAKVPHETTLCVFIPIKRNSDRAATIMKHTRMKYPVLIKK